MDTVRGEELFELYNRDSRELTLSGSTHSLRCVSCINREAYQVLMCVSH